MRKALPLACLALLLTGCPVMQDQDTPVPEFDRVEPRTKAEYWMYVPSYYSARRSWPLVITLHGTYGFDSAHWQVKEWKALAEEKGFIVVAPELDSVQGVLPVSDSRRVKQLREDERTIVSVLRDVAGEYRVDRDHVMLTGFSAGGYPLYYVGLRNPDKFDILVARACNCDIDLLEEVGVNQANRRLKVFIFWGKDDLKPIRDAGWQAFRYLRQRGLMAERDTLRGGHQRRPRKAYEYWETFLPPRYHNP
jgi:poly(3-hydroxybutyrate) depolymerase